MRDILLVTIPSALSALVAYLVARRSTSGNISTSAASDLWNEGQAIRIELRDEVTQLRGIIRELNAHIGQLEQESFSDKKKIIDLTSKVKELEGRVRDLEIRI
jgi:peptidoglycan hydrolase CwlO-like protein